MNREPSSFLERERFGWHRVKRQYWLLQMIVFLPTALILLNAGWSAFSLFRLASADPAGRTPWETLYAAADQVDPKKTYSAHEVYMRDGLHALVNKIQLSCVGLVVCWVSRRTYSRREELWTEIDKLTDRALLREGEPAGTRGEISQ